MRLGCCGSLEQAHEIASAGFDYLEVNVQHVLKGDEPTPVWEATAPDPAKLPLPIEAASVLLAPTQRLIGPERNFAQLTQYMQRVTERAERLGIQRIVLGSAKARMRPANVDHALADQHLIEFCQMAGDLCAKHRIMLVIEQLSESETNTINNVTQAKILCDHVNRRTVSLLLDSYHLGPIRHNDEAILELGDRVQHIHVAEVHQRWQPGVYGQSPEAYDFDHFFCLIRKLGYDDRVSVAAHWNAPIPQAGPACVAFLRDAWEGARTCESD